MKDFKALLFLFFFKVKTFPYIRYWDIGSSLETTLCQLLNMDF